MCPSCRRLLSAVIQASPSLSSTSCEELTTRHVFLSVQRLSMNHYDAFEFGGLSVGFPDEWEHSDMEPRKGQFGYSPPGYAPPYPVERERTTASSFDRTAPWRMPERYVIEGGTLCSFATRMASEGAKYATRKALEGVECAKRMAFEGAKYASQRFERAKVQAETTDIRSRWRNVRESAKRTLRCAIGAKRKREADQGDAESQGSETDYWSASEDGKTEYWSASEASETEYWSASEGTKHSSTSSSDGDGDSVTEDEGSTVSGPCGFRATRSATSASSSDSEDEDLASGFRRIKRCRSV